MADFCFTRSKFGRRSSAYRLLAAYEKRFDKKGFFHVGLHFNNRVAFDIDSAANPQTVDQIALWLAEKTCSPVGIFGYDAKAGHWIVTKDQVSHGLWIECYEEATKFTIVDQMHRQLSLKYDSTVLRVSSTKQHGLRPVLLKEIKAQL